MESVYFKSKNLKTKFKIYGKDFNERKIKIFDEFGTKIKGKIIGERKNLIVYLVNVKGHRIRSIRITDFKIISKEKFKKLKFS